MLHKPIESVPVNKYIQPCTPCKMQNLASTLRLVNKAYKEKNIYKVVFLKLKTIQLDSHNLLCDIHVYYIVSVCITTLISKYSPIWFSLNIYYMMINYPFT